MGYGFRLSSTFVSTLVLFGIIIYYFFMKDFPLNVTDGWYNMIQSIVQSAFGSLLFFTIVFYFLKPSIAISDDIVKNKQFRLPNETGYTTTDDLIIKVINTSFFKAIETTVCLYEVRNIDDSGKHYKYDFIHKFLPNEVGPPFILGWLEGTFSSHKGHALQVRINKRIANPARIENAMNDPQSKFMVTIHVRNSFSGISTTFHKEYDNNECIKPGKFKSGNSFKVKPC